MEKESYHHFVLSEFFVGCSITERQLAMQDVLIMEHIFQIGQLLYSLRCKLSNLHWFDVPIRINSCYRDKGHNARVNGVSSSDHLTAGAVDFTCSYLDDAEYIIKSCFDFGQLIRYDNFIHLSLPTTKHVNEYIDKRISK